MTKKPTKRKAPRRTASWVKYLPAIIQASTALLEVLLKHLLP